MQFCGTGTGLDIIGSFLIQMIWLDYYKHFLTTRRLTMRSAKPLFIQKQVACLASPAKQATVIVSPVPVLCIVLHYITAAAMVEMLGMSRFLHQCCLRTYLRPTHNTALLCFVPFPLSATSPHQTDPFPSGSYCWRWQNWAPLLQWWAHKPT